MPSLSKPCRISTAVGHLVHEVMERSFEQYMQDFELDIDGHFFSELPKNGLYSQIRQIAEAGTRIYICSRSGAVITESDMLDLSTISHIDTIPLTARLGNIVTDASKRILMAI